MEQIQQIAIVVGSAIFVLLGGGHLYYILFTDRLSPRNKQLAEAMQNDHIKLTRQTTVYNAWFGFNISHSVGLIFSGLINVILALGHPEIICHSKAILILDFCLCLSFVVMAKKYFFKTPFLYMMLSTICFAVAAILVCIHGQ